MIDVVDRVPRYPGRVTLTPVSGQANTYDLQRADDPIQEGTPINRALFESIEGDITTTRTDLMEEIAAQTKIGDISLTVRTDKGNNWLPCNGQAITESEYPELYAFLEESAAGAELGLRQLSTETETELTQITRGGGTTPYWVACGTGGRIFYTTSLSGTWQVKQVISDGYDLTGIVYADGKWVVCGNTGSPDYYPFVAYASLPSGTWTMKQIASSGTFYTGNTYLTYGNGSWVLATPNTSSYMWIYYTTDPTGTWTQKSDHVKGTFVCLTYGDGYFVGSAKATNTYPSLRYSMDPGRAWVSKTISSSLSSNTMNEIIYANGYWVACGGKSYIAYSTSISGTWSIKKIDFSDVTTGDVTLRGIAWDGSQWHVCGLDGYTGSCSTLNGDWAVQKAEMNADLIDMTFANNAVAVCGNLDNYPVIGYYGVALPTISYGYIKALDSET